MSAAKRLDARRPAAPSLLMPDPVLLQLLNLSLSEWPALQLAIDQGMGGPAAHEKKGWMGQVIYDFLLLNQHVVDEDELHDYISDMMDNEFDTIVDDGSMTFLTRRIRYFCKLVLDSNEHELRNILDKKLSDSKASKPSAAPAAAVATASTPSPQPAEATGTHEEAKMIVDRTNGTAEDEDWTLVTRKSNRRV